MSGGAYSWSEEIRNCTCEHCGERFDHSCLTETGMHEYYRLNLDVGMLICDDCLDAEHGAATPDDCDLFDCYTPLDVIH